MTVPLDRLYHFIENNVKEAFTDPIVIYRFDPHGSKNINDLTPLHHATFADVMMYPKILCFDQEPTNLEFYKEDTDPNSLIFESLGVYSHLDRVKFGGFKKYIFLHSEKRFNQTDDNLIPVYYWSHGLIAYDWFRYAKHEIFQKNSKKIFLIYNRSWSGYREYRIKFADLLIENNLTMYCQASFNAVDPELGIHYTSHKFTNQRWQAKNVIENFLQPTEANATSSADFTTADYNSTDIEVVLETLFDYPQLHLTEKSLRPIACQQPFIIVGTQGSLEYLRNYGFKTFSSIWNESYDQIENPEERLNAVVDVMKEIASWDEITRKSKLSQAQEIAIYNQQWFLSQDFFNLVTNELKENLKVGLEKLKEYCDNFDWAALIESHENQVLKNSNVFDSEHKKNNMLRNNEGMLLLKTVMQSKAKKST